MNNDSNHLPGTGTIESAKVTRAPYQTRPPIVDRLHALWESMREQVISIFPKAPALPNDWESCMSCLDDVYPDDAYHSLSIEGYHVTPELIRRVRNNSWNNDNSDTDNFNRDLLAARGYWQAFQLVKKTISNVVAGDTPATRIRGDHKDWYSELFQPSVAAGLVAASTLHIYRNHAVYLRGSRYVPPRWEAVRDAMPAYFDLLESEPEPSVKIVLGHLLFGYIHPYPDGNGRLARFVMNVLLVAGGYPWTTIRVDDRAEYLATLETASVDQNIKPFAQFLSEQVEISSNRTE